MKELEPYVARALMNRLLTEDERSDLRKYEAWLQNQVDIYGKSQKGRYVTSFEICQRFHLKPEPVAEADIESMNKLYWKYQQIWGKKYDELFEQATEPFNVTGNELIEDLWAWEKFAEENYDETKVSASVLAFIPLLVLLGSGRVY